MKTWFEKFPFRIPSFNKILPVYAVTTFVIYGWSLYWFLYEMPGWTQYLYFSEIISLYAYIVLVNFLESFLILLISIAICMLLPQKWFLDEYVYRGTMMSLFFAVYLIALAIRRSQIMEFSNNMVSWFPVIWFISLFVILLTEKVQFLKSAVEGFADRATVLLFINIPVSIVAIVFVIARSIF